MHYDNKINLIEPIVINFFFSHFGKDALLFSIYPPASWAVPGVNWRGWRVSTLLHPFQVQGGKMPWRVSLPKAIMRISLGKTLGRNFLGVKLNTDRKIV